MPAMSHRTLATVTILGAVACLALLMLFSTAGLLLHRRPAVLPTAPAGPPSQQQLQEQHQEEEEAEQERRLPQGIVIGARKCGTRALLDFLELHPMVRAAKEEVHYFDREDRQRLGLAWYRSRMPLSRPGDVTLEKSPAYFVTDSAPARVWRMNPRVRLLLILRDPVDRVVSDYAQHVHRRQAMGKPARPLEAIVLRRRTVNPRAKMVHTSLYHRHLRRWLRFFRPGQIHLVDGDRLVRRPHLELQRVEDFLGLPRHIQSGHFVFNATKGFYCLAGGGGSGGGGERCLGSEKGRKHPPVSNATLAKLRRFYAEHDAPLERLTGRQFDWMRRSGDAGGDSGE